MPSVAAESSAAERLRVVENCRPVGPVRGRVQAGIEE
jgi:hypothetical protein